MVSGQLHHAQALANRSLLHVQTIKYVSDLTHQTARKGTKSSGYRGTGPSERVGSVNGQSAHHRVVSGQLHDAQTPANRPLTHVQTAKYVSDLTHQTARKGTKSNGYRGTGPNERFGSVNE